MVGWNISPFNRGRTRSSKLKGGIPGERAHYIFARDDVCMHQNICVVGDVIYTFDEGFKIRALNYKSNSELWRCDGGQRFCQNILVTKDYLATTWKVVSLDGEEIFDWCDIAGSCGVERSALHPLSNVYFLGDAFLRVVNYSKPENGAILYKLGDGAKCLSFPFRAITQDVKDDHLFYGWSGSVLKCNDIAASSNRWELDLSKELNSTAYSKYPVISDKKILVCTDGKKTLLGVDACNGDIRWKYESIEADQNKALSIGADEGVLIIHHGSIDEGDFYALDITNGSLLWKQMGMFGSSFCIEGDIIFAVRNKHSPVALDTHNGQVIWEAEDEITTRHIITCDNKVIYTWTYLSGRIYEWDQSYISPHRK